MSDGILVPAAIAIATIIGFGLAIAGTRGGDR